MEGTDWGARSTMMPDAFIYRLNLPGTMPDLMCHLGFNKKAINLATEYSQTSELRKSTRNGIQV